MDKFIYFTILLSLMFLGIFLLNKLRHKTTNELEKVLYIQKRPKLYLQLLKNPKLKILYKKSLLFQFELNAYLLLGDDVQIESHFKLLDGITMTKGESLEYNQKKLSYYCSQGNKDQAQSALHKIEKILSRAKGKQAQLILNESKMIFDIYIRRDTKLIEKLEQIQVNQHGVVRGLTLYRLAKLNYFNQNNEKAKKYLIQAKGLLRNTGWYDIVNSALKDISILNTK